MTPFRIGFGYDVHAFAKGRKLMLGGIEIPFDRGLKGHSDADVLLHAICDALLGALGLGDIGKHFPDTDPAYKGADSKVLLKECMNKVREAGYELGNIDATVVTEAPKLSGHIDSIRKSLSRVMEVKWENISVKATTSEKMGFVGKEEGMAAMAVALVMRTDSQDG